MTRTPTLWCITSLAALVVLPGACGVDGTGLGPIDPVLAPPARSDAGASALALLDGATARAGDVTSAAVSNGSDGMLEGGAVSDAATDERGDAASPSAATEVVARDVGLPDAGSDSVAVVQGPAPCDQDGDGHLAMGGSCLGDDCCDTDPNVHPGQALYFSVPGRCGSYDYDCDGKLTQEYGVASCQWSALGCGSGNGFQQATDCGVTAPFLACTPNGLLACTVMMESMTQACR